MTLFVCGLVTVLALWLGPGGSRFRGPLTRVVNPLSPDPVPWAGGVGLLVGAALGLGVLATDRGTDWSPIGDPLSAGTSPSVAHSARSCFRAESASCRGMRQPARRPPWHTGGHAPRRTASSFASASTTSTRRPLVPTRGFLLPEPATPTSDRESRRWTSRARSTSTTRPCATAPSRRDSTSPSPTSSPSRGTSTGSASATSRAGGRAPTPRTPSSSGGPAPSWTSGTRSSRRSAPPGVRRARRPTTRWSPRCATAARAS